MKNIFFILLCSFLVFNKTVKGQNNLQFSQVRYLTLSGYCGSCNGGAYLDSFIVTVAANKVLKIESAGTNIVNSNGYSLIGSSGYFSLAVETTVIYQTGNYDSHLSGPIWLPSGTYTLRLMANTASTDVGVKGFISALEFNIVP